MLPNFKDGYTNVIYMSRSLYFSPEAVKMMRQAESKGLTVYNENTVEELHRKRKLCIHKFGHLPDFTYNKIIKNKGIVISGDLYFE